MYITHTPSSVSIKEYKRNDCTVIAMGNALGLSYDLSKKIYQTAEISSNKITFRKSSPRTKADFMRTYFVEKLCSALSVQTVEYKNNRRRVSFPKFAEENPKGTFFILSKSHISVAINGKLIDSWDSSKLIIERAYRINVKQARKLIEDLAKFYKMNDSNHMLIGHEKKVLQNAVKPIILGRKMTPVKIQL